jgi:hypothetical protein
LSCQLSKKLEDTGDYEAVRRTISEFWQRIGEPPKIEGLERGTTAEVLLRAGVMAGLIGNKHQITSAQETAKNLLCEGLSIFESLGDKRKVAEAQIELALCHWREGSYDEARIMLNGVLAELKANDELKAKALLRLAIIERAALGYSEALQILIDNAPLFEKTTNNTLKESYHNNLANLWD